MTINNSLYIGISGLQAHGEAISVVGDNIANVSTIGYKRNRASFNDVLGGELMNQRQGGGVFLGANQTMWEQGSITQTGNPMDLAISGGGMFMVKGSERGHAGTYYSRDGRFKLDNSGMVVNQNGMRLQGYSINGQGVRSTTPGDLPLGARQSAPVASTKASMTLNLDATSTPAAAWDPANPQGTSNYATGTTVYDSLGAAHHVEVYFRNNGGGSWEWHAMVDSGELAGGTPGTLTELGTGTMSFDANGSLASQSGNLVASFNNATAGQTIAMNFGDDIASGGTGRNGTTQEAGASAVTAIQTDGHGYGNLTDLEIADDGKIVGVYDNGDRIAIAQVALVDFASQEGLERTGDGLMIETTASGKPLVDVPGTGARGSLVSGALEASNVDLSNELVTLIAYQRAFQANAKTVTTADEMMADVTNLKR